jgi:hypothetical protein
MAEHFNERTPLPLDVRVSTIDSELDAIKMDPRHNNTGDTIDDLDKKIADLELEAAAKKLVDGAAEDLSPLKGKLAQVRHQMETPWYKRLGDRLIRHHLHINSKTE